MNVKNSPIIRDASIKYSLIICIFFIGIQIILLGVSYTSFPPFVPFFNSLPWGTDRLALSQFVFLVPVASCIVFAVNMYIANRVYKKHTLISRILAVNSFLVSFLGLLALAQIVLLVY